MVRKFAWFLTAAFVITPPVFAADERPSPQLTATVEGVVGEKSQELAIEQLDIDIRRHGSIATTEITVRFANPGNETLEGQFALSMPKGSIVTGYALDVNGAMIDGVLQPRDRARTAFEKRVVRRIDPGLAEVDFSDRFETRVYPIFPKQGRTIRIRFTSPLDAGQQYMLPLETDQVGKYSIKVRGIAPKSGNGIKWQAEGADFIANGSGELDGEIVFSTPESDGLILSEHPGEGAFFELTGKMAPAAPAQGGPLTILWDRSVSRLDDELAKEADLAADLAKSLGVSEVKLVQFDSGATEVDIVSLADLKKTLGNIRYAGGTSYAGLAEKLAETEGTCVLFSDGRATIGDRSGFGAAKCRLIVVGSGKEADRAWLEGQARLLGGAYVDLNDLKGRDAVKIALTPSAVPVITDSAKKAIEIRALPAGQGRYRLVGPMPQDGRLIVNGKEMTSPSPVVPNFTGPGALWAAQHIALTRDSMGSEKLAEEARRWSVAVPGVSFIVLETPADYVEAGFVPPDSYPKDLREQFNQLQQAQAAREREADQRYREYLGNLWKARKAWWADWKQNGSADKEEETDVERPLFMPPPPPAPPPPPRPVTPAPSPRPSEARQAPNETAEVDDRPITVTGRKVERSIQEMPVAVTVVSAETLDGGTADAAAAAESNASPSDRDVTDSIQTAEWSVDRPYIKEWVDAGDKWPEAVAKTEKTHGSIPLFYLDLAEWHFRAGRAEEAKRAAAAALDLPSRDNQTLAIVAQRLLRYGDADGAIWLLTMLADVEAERPQPLMALSRAYAERGRRTGKREDLVHALQIMVDTAMKRWDGEYRNVGEIALGEANALIVELGGAQKAGVALDSKFVAALPVDVRVVVEWNTPRTDLDLWVREPSGEEVGYSNRDSKAGGVYTHDLTAGYGPEEYQIRKAPDGTYRVEVKTFAVDRRNPNGPSVVTVRLIRNFASLQQTEQTIDVEMQPDAQGRKLIGTIKVE